MSQDEIEAALQAAFNRCDAASCPLTDTQKQILLQVVEQIQGNHASVSDVANPLDETDPRGIARIFTVCQKPGGKQPFLESAITQRLAE